MGAAPTGSRRPGEPASYDYAWGRQNWHDASGAEHRAVREAVGLFDQSSFGKFLVQGRDALRGAEPGCRVSEIDVPVGPRGLHADAATSAAGSRRM